MSDEDDWFEQAIREDEEDEQRPNDDERGPDDDSTDPESIQGKPAGEESEAEVSPDSDDESGVEAGVEAGEPEPDSDGDGASPFDRDFADAFENAPSPEGGGVPGANGPSPASGTGFDGSQPGAGEPQAEFDAQQGGFEEATFDEESFESDLERLDIGVEGLDNMILGGVPRRSLMVAIGSAGTGKTTFGLQFLNHGLENGEAAVYITLEESYDRILATAAEKGWDFEGYVDDDRLAIVDIDPVEMANSLDSIQNDLPELIEEFGADRLVLDSVSLLEMMYEHTPKRRSQVFGFTRALKRAGITTLLTSEANEENAFASRFGIVEYLADAVFVLQYVRGTDFRETRLAIEIQKIRDANHSRATKPYELTESGISVYRQANLF
ncbi:KaiC domain-containing protein [Halobellus rufus]|uniref:KaiC domain-containing protein n=1 Tax=Halobellus rufus TaxID=1448860 RepID=UPI000678699C|nr:KaiC domain-containing protein [Halobellus rufus]